CEKRGRRRVFDILSPCLAAERDNVSYSKFSKALGIPEGAVKRLVHQMRVRYRALLREEVGLTVEKPDEIDDELRYLCAGLSPTEYLKFQIRHKPSRIFRGLHHLKRTENPKISS